MHVVVYAIPVLTPHEGSRKQTKGCIELQVRCMPYLVDVEACEACLDLRSPLDHLYLTVVNEVVLIALKALTLALLALGICITLLVNLTKVNLTITTSSLLYHSTAQHSRSHQQYGAPTRANSTEHHQHSCN
jgi:hypothetical protein